MQYVDRKVYNAVARLVKKYGGIGVGTYRTTALKSVRPVCAVGFADLIAEDETLRACWPAVARNGYGDQTLFGIGPTDNDNRIRDAIKDKEVRARGCYKRIPFSAWAKLMGIAPEPKF